MFFKNDKDESDEGTPTRSLPLLPLRDIIVFPHMVVPLFVGREKSINALEEAMEADKELLLAAQKKAKTNDPREDDIFSVGTVGHIIQLLRLPDGTVKVLVEGKQRARILGYEQTSPFFLAEVQEIAEPDERTVEMQALMRSIQTVFENYVKLNKRIPPEFLVSVQTIEDPARLADTIVAQVSLKLKDKQEILETVSPAKRLERLYELMQAEIEILQVEKKIRTRVKKQMEKSQKEYYLNEQMQAIQKELGDRDEFKNELNDLEQKIKQKRMSLEARERCLKEFKKLKMMSPMSAEATVVRNYIDWVLALPWDEKSDDRTDIIEAEKILEADHYGLNKVKERILEYLAVQTLVDRLKGPIICLVGPPGVGKTSLARSIARATGRKFVRQSLGGVRDEAEIRGHRRTYIGALPGKVLQSLKKVGTNNPVFLLDEIDKMSQDFRGDPASALLEVLDPEQNDTFNDHYLDLDYDLSDVMFITTANTWHQIPLPLQDRLEIIELPGYTEWEKIAISNQYLIPKQREANGIQDLEVNFTEESLQTIIHRYTKEAGVRNLERELATCCRKLAKDWLTHKKPKKKAYEVTPELLQSYLGVEKFRANKREEANDIGLANGLAVTSHGGDLLPAEVAVMPGKGKLTLTGKLGDVMQESAQAAMSYIRSRALSLGLTHDFQTKIDGHVHFPEGAIPKDGPSAGITMATAIASALLRIPVRQDLAMTGEITLRGRVLPVGGIKEKILAAHRAEILEVLIPHENEKDLKDIPEKVMEQMTIHPVRHMDEVLKLALAHDDPDSFLVEPTEVIDWRLSGGNDDSTTPPKGTVVDRQSAH
ncbi:endopeptidase La [Haliangium ochraceum]|uniref:Lon protease n=1 Tax=Haliangium ochraceum (strain DSM 14365 / JCM 11303 / SMP-2) TaxID=502025 RepID=D0LVB5_HALO1|nr:endopeptidase La [Haliangium ochraceum]ACY17476.1 ATP-dependent protease La [Haliangium ochraceum DSM 14365]